MPAIARMARSYRLASERKSPAHAGLFAFVGADSVRDRG